MRVTVMPTLISAIETISKGFIRGLEELDIGGRAKTIKTTALLRLVRIPRGILENLAITDVNVKKKSNNNK